MTAETPLEGTTAPGPLAPAPPVHAEHQGPPEALPEGEEAPPPGWRVMAVVRWALVVLMAAAASFTVLAHYDLVPWSRAEGSPVLYQCPMHPGVIQDQPGECPICGMTLVEVRRGAATDSPPTGVPATSPPRPPASPGAGSAAQPIYACPMHPEVTSADPSARCPKCGMPLEPVAASRPPEPPDAAGVPGLVPVMLSPRRVQLIGVKTAPAEVRALAPEVRTVGYVAYDETRVAHVHVRFAGWIERLLVEQTGARVEKGELLASVYSPQLLAAQQELLSARRWGRTLGDTGSPDAFRDDARRRLSVFGMSTSQINRVLKSGKASPAIAIHAPAGGYVLAKQAVEGLYVEPNTELFVIVDLARIWVLADVYEQEAARVTTGLSASFALSSDPGTTYAGTVEFVSPVVDASTRALRVRLAFDNPTLALKPGMYGTVTLHLPPLEGLSVPRSAVADTGERQYVFLARGEGVFEPRTVRLGPSVDDWVLVREGLQAGDVVVTTANFFVDSESRLRSAIEGFSDGATATEASPPASPHAGHGGQ